LGYHSGPCGMIENKMLSRRGTQEANLNMKTEFINIVCDYRGFLSCFSIAFLFMFLEIA
jgi:hypothetical protein